MPANEVAVAEVPEVAIAVAQSPGFTVASVVLTVWEKVVALVQETATCPDCWFCTCMVVPVIAATVPDAAGPG